MNVHKANTPVKTTPRMRKKTLPEPIKKILSSGNILSDLHFERSFWCTGGRNWQGDHLNGKGKKS